MSRLDGRRERPMRIAMFTHSVNPRGGVVHALELGEALQRNGHRVTIVAPALAGQRFFREVACGVELALVDAEAGTAELVQSVRLRIDAVATHMRALLATRQFDVFHAQDSITGNALATLAEEGLIEGFFRTVHHLDDFEDAQLAAWQRRAHEQAKRVFCVSQLWCDTMRIDHGVDAALVHNGVNLARYGAVASSPDLDARVAERLGIRQDAPVVLAVGGIEERKNVVRLLEAFALLRRERPQSQLVIAGGASLLDHDSYGAQWHSMLAATGLRQTSGSVSDEGADVLVTGSVDDASMPSLYRLADVLAMPSLREGFGLSALEALASGTPVVVSRIAPFTEFLGDDDVCWADPSSAASIADALDLALKRRGALPHVDSSALFRRFNWPASALRHAELYRLGLNMGMRMPVPVRVPSPAPSVQP